MKKNFDTLQPGNIVADMHNPDKRNIEWNIEGEIKVTGWVSMDGTAVRDLILQQVRLHTGQPLWSTTNKMMHVIQETVSGYVCGFSYDMMWGAVCTIQQAPINYRHGGPVVMQTGTHFLRCDTVIRKEAGYPENEQEAYSLFKYEPYGRIAVYAGRLDWACDMARKEIAAHQQKVIDDALGLAAVPRIEQKVSAR